MADQRNGGIAYCDETWNPIRGCSLESPGCDNCFARRMAARFCRDGEPYEGLIDGNEWSGAARLIPERLSDPLRWRRPRRILVPTAGDLFHKSLTNEEIAAVFGVIAACPQHTFLLLTKRARRMRDLLTTGTFEALVVEAGERIATQRGWCHAHEGDHWPLQNLHLGVSVEDQSVVHRIDDLLQCPAAVRWVSAEPLLGSIDFTCLNDGSWYDREGAQCYNALRGNAYYRDGEHGLSGGPTLDWIVVGPETGPRRRHCDIRHIESIVEQGRAAGVPVFVKQIEVDDGMGKTRISKDPNECGGWPARLRIRMMPGDRWT